VYTTDMDNYFLKLHEELVARYGEELERARSEIERADSAELRDERVTRTFRESGINVEYLLELERESKAALGRFVERVRQPLIERPSLRPMDAKRRNLYHSANQAFVPPYAATLLAPDIEVIENNAGQTSEFWVLAYDPREFNIKAVSAGSGWGCATAVGEMPPPTAVILFTFIPDKTGMWRLVANADLHGFYVMRADDSWYDCKGASFYIDSIIDVSQFDFWHGEQRARLIGADRGNVSTYQLVDARVTREYMTILREGDPVWVALTIEIEAFAQGEGSYAEINLSDGIGNYVKPYGMFIAYQGQ
jgi:hypothetical protein